MTTFTRRLCVTVSFALFVFLPAPLFTVPVAQAAEPQSEANQVFDHGVRLWDQKNLVGALAEFRKAYQLTGEPFILCNVGLVEAKLGRPVEAAAALDQVLKNPAKVPRAQVDHAREILDQQRALIGYLQLVSNVDADVTVDGVAVGRAPMAASFPFAAGPHWVSLEADGYGPMLREVQVVAGKTITLPVELSPMAGSLAHITVDSPVPAAEIVLDGKVVGRTPLGGTLPVAPGAHDLVVRRAGYLEARSSLALASGASRTLSLIPSELPGTTVDTGLSTFQISEPDATVEIDGRPRPDYRLGLRLPAGVHHLTVFRSGFFPVERQIVSQPTAAGTTVVTLEPTEETRVARVDRARRQRRWAWATVAAGALIGGSALFLYGRNRSELRGAEAESAEVASMIARGGQCDPKFGVTELCQQLVDHANDRLDRAQTIRTWSLVAAGVGAATLVTGAVLRLTSEDPHRYDFERPRQDREIGTEFLASLMPGGAVVAVGGHF